MTYGQPAVCRRGGCGEPAEDRQGEPGDVGWCVAHGAEVRRARAVAPSKPGRPGARPEVFHQLQRGWAG